MPIEFVEEARRVNTLLRGFFMGPTGSGKSRAALEVASKLGDGSIPVTLINTEIGRASLYADRYRYALIDISEEDQSPETFVKVIDLAEERHPGATLVLDSASHEWMGENGVLQQADRFGEWKTVRPRHQAFVKRLLQYQGHVIVTCRAKMKYEVGEEEVNGRKKQVISMLGVGPIQDGDLQYEFNCVARFEQGTHVATFSGHVDELDGYSGEVIDEGATRVAAVLTKWLSEGEPPPPPPAATGEDVETLRGMLREEGYADEAIEARWVERRRENRGKLHPEYVSRQIELARERLAAKAPQAARAAADGEQVQETLETAGAAS